MPTQSTARPRLFKTSTYVTGREAPAPSAPKATPAPSPPSRTTAAQTPFIVAKVGDRYELVETTTNKVVTPTSSQQIPSIEATSQATQQEAISKAIAGQRPEVRQAVASQVSEQMRRQASEDMWSQSIYQSVQKMKEVNIAGKGGIISKGWEVEQALPSAMQPSSMLVVKPITPVSKMSEYQKQMLLTTVPTTKPKPESKASQIYKGAEQVAAGGIDIIGWFPEQAYKATGISKRLPQMEKILLRGATSQEIKQRAEKTYMKWPVFAAGAIAETGLSVYKEARTKPIKFTAELLAFGGTEKVGGMAVKKALPFVTKRVAQKAAGATIMGGIIGYATAKAPAGEKLKTAVGGIGLYGAFEGLSYTKKGRAGATLEDLAKAREKEIYKGGVYYKGKPLAPIEFKAPEIREVEQIIGVGGEVQQQSLFVQEPAKRVSTTYDIEMPKMKKAIIRTMSKKVETTLEYPATKISVGKESIMAFPTEKIKSWTYEMTEARIKSFEPYISKEMEGALGQWQPMKLYGIEGERFSRIAYSPKRIETYKSEILNMPPSEITKKSQPFMFGLLGKREPFSKKSILTHEAGHWLDIEWGVYPKTYKAGEGGYYISPSLKISKAEQANIYKAMAGKYGHYKGIPSQLAELKTDIYRSYLESPTVTKRKFPALVGQLEKGLKRQGILEKQPTFEQVTMETFRTKTIQPKVKETIFISPSGKQYSYAKFKGFDIKTKVTPEGMTTKVLKKGELWGEFKSKGKQTPILGWTERLPQLKQKEFISMDETYFERTGKLDIQYGRALKPAKGGIASYGKLGTIQKQRLAIVTKTPPTKALLSKPIMEVSEAGAVSLPKRDVLSYIQGRTLYKPVLYPVEKLPFKQKIFATGELGIETPVVSKVKQTIALKQMIEMGYKKVQKPKWFEATMLKSFAGSKAGKISMITPELMPPQQAQSFIQMEEISPVTTPRIKTNLMIYETSVIPKTTSKIMPMMATAPKTKQISYLMPTYKPMTLPKQVSIPKQISIPKSIQMPKQVSIPKQISMPKQVSIPKQISIPKQVQIPEQVQVPKQVQIPKQIQMPLLKTPPLLLTTKVPKVPTMIPPIIPPSFEFKIPKYKPATFKMPVSKRGYSYSLFGLESKKTLKAMPTGYLGAGFEVRMPVKTPTMKGKKLKMGG